MQLKNLYIFTGKGGVGKTTLSVAFAKYIISQNKKVIHFSFKNHSLDEGTFESQEASELCKLVGVEHQNLDLMECAIEYMGKKLNSITIAGWIARAPFFKALINMIPGFNYLIYLGKIFEIIHEAEKNNSPIICVLDSPSSGHALTMLESIQNFKDIFVTGLVFEDTKKMLAMFFKNDFSQINIITLPSLMAVHEAIELKDSIQKLGSLPTKIFANYGLCNLKQDIEKDGPSFLKEKLAQEEEVISSFQGQLSGNIPQSIHENKDRLFAEIVPLMKTLV